MNCKYIKTDAEGNVISAEETHISPIPVLSDEVIPKGLRRYEHVYIIDKAGTAVCGGNDTWYRETDDGVVSAAAGQTWAALFE